MKCFSSSDVELPEHTTQAACIPTPNTENNYWVNGTCSDINGKLGESDCVNIAAGTWTRFGQCSDNSYTTESTCTQARVWGSGTCSNASFTDEAACTSSGNIFTKIGICSDGSCSNNISITKEHCEFEGATWNSSHTNQTSCLADIVTYVTRRTNPLAFNIEAVQLQDKIQGIQGIGAVVVYREDYSSTSGVSGSYKWSVSFLSRLGNVPPFVADTSQLTGSNPTINITEFNGTTENISGTFKIGYYGVDGDEECEDETDICKTAELSVHATPIEMEKALLKLPSIDWVDVKRNALCAGGQKYTWTISFVPTSFIRGDQNLFANYGDITKGSSSMPLLSIDASNLVGTGTHLEVERVRAGIALEEGFVPVEITSNGEDFTDSGLLFEYNPAVSVTDLYPYHGPLYGRTEVLVVGSNFRNSTRTSCRFGKDRMVPISEYINSTHIRCIAPAAIEPGRVHVGVSLNGFTKNSNYTSNGALYHYNELIKIEAIEPNKGPTSGGVFTRILGSGFVESSLLKCRFGNIEVDALYITQGEIICESPIHSPGYFNLEITNNGQDYTLNEMPYWFYEDIKLERITPVSGPATAAGTKVTVYGRNFVNSTSLACRFGNYEVPGEFISNKEVNCYTPQSDTGLSWKDISVQANRHVDPFHGSRLLFPDAHYFPIYLSKLVSVEMSNNGHSFTDSGITFLYQKDAKVEKVTPLSGQDTGVTPVFVKGNYFVNTTSLRCRVGQDTMKATFLSPELLLCLIPPRPTIRHAHGQLLASEDEDMNSFGSGRGLRRVNVMHKDDALTGNRWPQNVFVEVSNNGDDFSTDWVSFEFEEPCETGKFCPTHENANAVVCPRGTFCPGTGNFNFTMCPKGTYQPQKGQADCLRCPIGYLCPERGMHVPQICPAGYVCDVTGTEVADQLCPPGFYCLDGTATTATTCGDPTLSSRLFPTLSLAERPTTRRLNRKLQPQEKSLGARNTACWSNATTDIGLMASPYPARFWAERHLMPLSPNQPFSAIRGKFCLDDSCLRLEDEHDMTVVDYAFDYSSSKFSLRRPVPCPEGTYCHAGTSVADLNMKNFTAPQPCFESMYCPEGSTSPLGVGKCPSGFYCPVGKRKPCPIGTYCPRSGNWDPMPCPPGTFNGMVGQSECIDCPRGFICPGYGRIDPAICPPGMVCSRLALTSPNIRCPKGNYCQNGTITSDPFRNDTTLRPYPCPPGSFCSGGVGFNVIKKGAPEYPQPCTEGFYCELGSTGPKGSGLCPLGFYCPAATAVPIPTARGQFAGLLGTVQPAQCRPGYYSPTIESVKCYPCPPGSMCENDGMPDAKICPPGTFRTTVEGDGIMCLGCPQGTWSKNWELRDTTECIPCPPGVVCPIDGMTFPCAKGDLPTPWVPTGNEESQLVCERKGARYRYGYLDPRRPWAIDSKGRGPYLIPSLQGQCFFNLQANGTRTYERLRDYHSSLYVLQRGLDHQGYGDADFYQGTFGYGSLRIDLPRERNFIPSRNCTSGYMLWNDTLQNDQWYPGQCEADLICNYDAKPQAEPCSEGYVCYERTNSVTALDNMCPPGYVCDYGTTPDVDLEAPMGVYKQLCTPGFFCPEGTGINQAERNVCPPDFFCPTGTAEPMEGKLAGDSVRRELNVTLADPFAPPLHQLHLPGVDLPGYYGDHDVRCFRGINGSARNPPIIRTWINDTGPWSENLKVGDSVSTDLLAYNYLPHSIYDGPVIPVNVGEGTIVNSIDKENGKITYMNIPLALQHRLYEIQSEKDVGPNYGKAKVNRAIEFDKLCGRDHKWRHNFAANSRAECDCVKQHRVIEQLFEFWKCTNLDGKNFDCHAGEEGKKYEHMTLINDTIIEGKYEKCEERSHK
eukprot:g3443.t1